MKYFLIAGERSGDLHGSNLIRALSKEDPSAVFSGVGGDQMQSAGMQLHMHYRKMAFMGFAEVLFNLRTIRKYMKRTLALVKKEKPDVLILIDYGGFNMKVAARIKTTGIPVYYYISPKVWAWNQKRGWKLRRIVDRMFVILPFEKEFFRKFSWDVDYVGNPVLDAVRDFETQKTEGGNYDIALLPGSRQQELQKVLPALIKLAEGNSEWKFAIATVDNIDSSIYNDILKLPNVSAFDGHTYTLLRSSRAAVVTSGTATLETALLNVPQVVVYRTTRITWEIGRLLVKIPFVSLVNLIADRQVVRELLQNDMTPENIENEVNLLLKDEIYRQKMLEGYAGIRQTLDVGRASANTARLMVGYLREK